MRKLICTYHKALIGAFLCVALCLCSVPDVYAIKVLTPKSAKPASVKTIKVAEEKAPTTTLAATTPRVKPQNNSQPIVVSDKTPKAKELYLAGEKAYTDLLRERELRQTRKNWQSSLSKFDEALAADRQGPWAAAALYAKAMIYKDMYHYFGSSDYLKDSREALQQIVQDYPQSSYKDKAIAFDKEHGFQAFSGQSLDTAAPNLDSPYDTKPPPAAITTATTSTATTTTTNAATTTFTPVSTGSASVNGQPFKAGQEVTVKPSTPQKGTATVSEVRHWSNPDYTRVVIAMNGPATYKYNLLMPDPAHNKPPRLYVDITDSRLGQQVEKSMVIDDDLLTGARAGQYTNDSVRVVIDLKSLGSYKIFPLNDPFRIVIDIQGANKGVTPVYTADNRSTDTRPTGELATAQQTSQTQISGVPGKDDDDYDYDPTTQHTGPVTTIKPPNDGTIKATDLAKQLGLGVKRIVVDAGHGGKDGGAPGNLKGVYEKTVVLQLAKKLKAQIEKDLGCEVILTRSTDVFISLEERMAIANSKNADLFISIHTNAAQNKSAFGIETYFLNLATDEESIRVAAMENATSTRGISDLQNILSDLMQNSKIQESSRLASYVQKSMVGNLKKAYGAKIKDKGVKQAPFYVLLGATMPSILVETGFISNADECKRLTDPQYQDALCVAITSGIKAYIKELQPTK